MRRIVAYHNAGSAGLEYSRIEVSEAPTVHEPMVEVVSFSGSSRNLSVWLTRAQVRDLFARLGSWLTSGEVVGAAETNPIRLIEIK